MRANELRALGRLGRRTARREWKRTTLIGLLVAVPVAIALVVAGVVRASDASPQERVATRFGTADVIVESSGAGPDLAPDVVDWTEDALAELAPDADVLAYRFAWDPSSGRLLDVDLSDPIAAGLLEAWEGELPSGIGEVALTPASQQRLDAEIGGTIELAGTELTVVGTVVQPLEFNHEAAVVTPDQFDTLARQLDAGVRGGGTTTTTRWLLNDVAQPARFSERLSSAWQATRPTFLPEPAVSPKPAALAMVPDEVYTALDADEVEDLLARSAELSEDELSVRASQMVDDAEVVAVPDVWPRTRQNEVASIRESLAQRLMTPGVVATLVAGVLLAEVALIAGAAYATGARRRLRELGLLGANGATIGHVRIALLGEAVVAGVVGALLGIVAGIGALTVGRPLVETIANRYLVGLPLTAGAVLGPTLAGLAAVVAAAWLPARNAARVPTSTALQGRMPLSSPPRWLAPAGAVLAAFGAVVTTVALAAGAENLSVALAVIGILTAIAGTALLTPPIIAGLGRLADRLPATLRLVVRDSKRQRTRAAAATAAAMVLLLVPVLVGFMSLLDESQWRVRGLQAPSDHVALSPLAAFPGGPPQVEGQPSETTVEEWTAAVTEVDALLSDATRTAVPLLPLVGMPESAPGSDELAALAGSPVEADEQRQVRGAIATGGLVEVLGDSRVAASLREGTPVLLGVEERATSVTLEDGTVLDVDEVPVAVVDAFPRLLFPPGSAEELGVWPTAELALFSGVELTSQLQRELWSIQVPGRLSMGASGPSPMLIRWLAVGAALLVTLVVLGLVTALATTESDHDLRTMVAVGAAPRVRRRFLALQSGYHAVIGALLAVPLGAGFAWAVTRSNPWQVVGPFGARMSNDLIVPWLVLAAVVIGLPLVAAALTMALFRSAPTVPPRRIG